MRLETFQYQKDKGWSVRVFPKLDSKKTVLFIFGSPDMISNQAVFAELNKAYPQSVKVGCSSSGEVFGNQIFDNSLSVAVAQFANAEVQAFTFPIATTEQSFGAGRILAQKLNRPDLSAVFVLSDGIRVNGSELVHGMSSLLPPGTCVTGGLAGDGTRFKETWVINGGLPMTGHVTALGLYGKSIRVEHGSQGGWTTFGPKMNITKAKGNVLFELDGKPALQIYKEYLGPKAKELPSSALLFPLQIHDPSNKKETLVRTILGVDEAKQSMTFAGDMPEGFVAQTMRADMNRLIEGASNAAKVVPIGHAQAKRDLLTIAISCVGRRLVLGDRTAEEVAATLNRMPQGTKQVGFYSYGEISPFVKGKACELHNQTMTLTTISEEDAA